MDNDFPVTFEERAYVQRVSEMKLVLPEPIHDLIMGFGNVTMLSGAHLLYEMPPRDYITAGNIVGWFGRIGPTNHFIYKSIPCLAVYAQRICQDLAVSSLTTASAIWNLPEEVRPLEPDAGYPTRNLLGYDTAIRYRMEVVTFIQATGVTPTAFPSENGSVPFNPALLSAIASQLRTTTAFRLMEPVFDSLGSPAQIPFQKNVPGIELSEANTRTMLTGDLLSPSSEEVDGRFSSSAAVYLYRLFNEPVKGPVPPQVDALKLPALPRVPEEGATSAQQLAYIAAMREYSVAVAAIQLAAGARQPMDPTRIDWWCIYQFENFTRVPDSWFATRNSLRNKELPGFNHETFVAPAYNLSVRLSSTLARLRRE